MDEAARAIYEERARRLHARVSAARAAANKIAPRPPPPGAAFFAPRAAPVDPPGSIPLRVEKEEKASEAQAEPQVDRHTAAVDAVAAARRAPASVRWRRADAAAAFAPDAAPPAWRALFASAHMKTEVEHALGKVAAAGAPRPAPALALTPFRLVAGGPRAVRAVVIASAPMPDSLGYAFGARAPGPPVDVLRGAALAFRAMLMGGDAASASFDATLAEWAMQGVLLINLAFFATLAPGERGRDPAARAWLGVMQVIIDEIVRSNRHLLVMPTRAAAPATLGLRIAPAHIIMLPSIEYAAGDERDAGLVKETAEALARANGLLISHKLAPISW